MVTIADDLAANFERVRRAHGWSWEEMAQQFERDGEAARAAASPMHPFSEGFGILAAWAREHDQAEPPVPRPDPGTEAKPGPPKRDSRQKPPPRTA